MAEMKKYLDATALAALVDQVKAEDVKTLNAAKAHAEGLATNYDAAGAAATAKAEAIADADGKLANKVDKVEGKDLIATSEITRLASVTNYDDTAVRGLITNVEGEIADLEAYVGEIQGDPKTVVEFINSRYDELCVSMRGLQDYVGEIPETAEATTVIGYIDEKTSDITHYLGEIPETATAETVIGYIDEKTAGIASDVALTEIKERVDDIDILIEDLDTITQDHDTKIEAIENDYLKAADKTELEGKITANANAITALTDGIDPDKIDGLTDLVNWANEHAPEVESIKEDIEANAKAIADQATSDAATYETKADATSKKTEIDGRLDVIEPKVEGWDATKSTVDANKATWDKAGTALQAADLADYAKTADVVKNDEFTAFEATNTAAIQAAQKAGEDAAAAVADDVDALTTTMTQVESVLGSYMENSPHPGGIPGIIGDYSSVSYGPSFPKATIVDDLATVVGKLGPDVWGNTATVGERINALEAIDHDFASADTALHTTISAEIDADVKALADGQVATNTAAIAANTSAINSFTPITAAEVEALFA